MSAQTGTPSIAPPPPSSRGMARMRGQVTHWRSTPNPVWIRELRQSARLTRTPFILMTVTALTALLLCAIGGILASTGWGSPARTGVALHQTFFSVAFFVVTIAGPAVAANSIASEREGKTWEALLLTGLSPRVVARGKFLAAYTDIALYIVMMSPVGALPFLFGGVTATEIVAAFGCLFVLAALSVAFGLAISSKMDSMRAAILVTMLVAFTLSPTAYVLFGFVVSVPIHAMWPGVPEYTPVWLPTALERVPFSLPYLGYLVLAPLAAAALPAWFLYEVTLANLRSPSDDRSTGVRRWFLVTTALGIAGGVAFVAFANPSDRAGAAELSLILLFSHLVFCCFVFAGEPIGPSRRVLLRWEQSGRGVLARILGPGVMRASLLLLALGLLALFAVTGSALLVIGQSSSVVKISDAHSVAIVGGYAAGFTVFLAGFTAWVRARTNSPSMARVLLLVVLFFAAAGPWILAAIAGAFRSRGGDESYIVACISPIYALKAATAVRLGSPFALLASTGSMASSAAWALLGLGLLGRAGSICGRLIRLHEEGLAATDARLAEEDAASALAAATDASRPEATDEGETT